MVAAAAQAALVADWTDGVGQAQERLVAAAQTLATSEGKVADDAVRTTLAQAIAQVTALVDAAPDSADLTDEAVAQLTAAVATLDQAVAAVTEAQAAWQAEQDALAAQQAAAPPPRTSGRSGGAGADCGGQGSYEPSSGGGGGAVFYTSTPAVDGNGTNGRMPRSAMTALPWCVDSQGNQQWLRSDAAEALIRMNEAFRAEFGENIAVDLTYRSYDDQVAMREAYGSGAAEPGTSNHGQGTAFDTWEWAAYSFGTPRYDWLVTTGRQYGWVSPVWAREDGSSPEYWHYEYTG